MNKQDNYISDLSKVSKTKKTKKKKERKRVVPLSLLFPSHPLLIPNLVSLQICSSPYPIFNHSTCFNQTLCIICLFPTLNQPVQKNF